MGLEISTHLKYTWWNYHGGLYLLPLKIPPTTKVILKHKAGVSFVACEHVCTQYTAITWLCKIIYFLIYQQLQLTLNQGTNVKMDNSEGGLKG